MLKTRWNTRAALGVMLGAGTATGIGGATHAAPPGESDLPLLAIYLHNEQGDLSVASYWGGAGGCPTCGGSWFRGVGALTDGDGQSWVSGVSPDGRVVVGRSFGAPLAGMPPAWHGVAWTSCGGVMPTVGTSSPTFGSEARSASEGGRIIVGAGADKATVACRWFGAGELELIVDQRAGQPQTTATGVSADGEVLVGSTFDGATSQAFILIAGRPNALALGDLPGGSAWSEAAGISGNGAVVIGRSDSASGMQAFRWSDSEGMIGLGDLAGGSFHSEASAASADGSVIVGWGSTSAGIEAFRWTAAAGLVGLGDLPGGESFSQADAVSADGRIVVGRSSSLQGGEAFIWDAAHGMRSLSSVLVREHGLDLTGWTLVSATGISADGRTIVGNGYNGRGQSEGWVVKLPDACPADWDGNGVVDSTDFFGFLNGFFVAAADFNHDGGTDSLDYFAFLSVFFGGC